MDVSYQSVVVYAMVYLNVLVNVPIRVTIEMIVESFSDTDDANGVAVYVAVSYVC